MTVTNTFNTKGACAVRLGFKLDTLVTSMILHNRQIPLQTSSQLVLYTQDSEPGKSQHRYCEIIHVTKKLPFGQHLASSFEEGPFEHPGYCPGRIWCERA